jgi:hypothetical protein
MIRPSCHSNKRRFHHRAILALPHSRVPLLLHFYHSTIARPLDHASMSTLCGFAILLFLHICYTTFRLVVPVRCAPTTLRQCSRSHAAIRLRSLGGENAAPEVTHGCESVVVGPRRVWRPAWVITSWVTLWVTLAEIEWVTLWSFTVYVARSVQKEARFVSLGALQVYRL